MEFSAKNPFAPKDKRRKGCVNEECKLCEKAHRFDKRDEYCPRCGERLAYVCRDCHKPLESDDPRRDRCLRCEAKRADARDKGADVAKKAGGVAAAAGAAVVGVMKVVAKRL